MTLAWICAASLIAATSTTDDPLPTAQSSYHEALEKAGRSPEEQVKLALWCEAHGLDAERLHHLSLAVLADPAHAMARGLMGLVSRDGRWQRPEAVADRAKADPALAEYEQRRKKVAYTAEAQWSLGLWAEAHGLAEQARAHLTAVIRLDPSFDAARKKLGYKKHDGRWVTDGQLAVEKAEAEAQKAADRKWKSALEKLRGMLEQPSRRAEAEAALAEVADPRAVPTIMHTYATNRPGDQLRAVQLLGQVDSPSASRALAGLAVLSKSAEVRRVALETLKRRDPRDFVRLWIALIRKPIKYEVRPVGGPGSPGALFVEGQKANLQRIYAPPALPALPDLSVARITYDANGLPVLDYVVGLGVRRGSAISERQFRESEEQQQQSAQLARANFARLTSSPSLSAVAKLGREAGQNNLAPYRNVNRIGENPKIVPLYTPFFDDEMQIQVPIGEMAREAEVSAAVAQQQLASDVSALEGANDSIRRSNDAVVMALKAVTGGDLGDDRTAWNRWWTDQIGYAITAESTPTVPTIVENVPIGYTPTATPTFNITESLVGFQRDQHSCFAGGTAIRTIDGERPIESIRAGDLVLVQDTKTGALAYQAVVAAYHNPPSPTLKVKLGEAESVVATGIHRFWRVGKGWTMARDLKAGDLVRTLGGAAKVSAVEGDRTQPVFNLEVGEGHSFLVGRLGALVHDNSLVEATPAPFDAASTPVVAKARAAD